MVFDGAVIKEQGQTFGIVIVKPITLQDNNKKSEMQNFGVRAFGRMPIILASQNSKGLFTYYGRTDIVKFLASIDARRIPWKRYTVD